MTNPLKQSISFLTDSLKRARIEGEILKLAKKLLVKPDACLDFEGVNFAEPTPEAATLLLILQNITKKHREYSLVNFRGGVALVRTEDVEKLTSDIRDVNEKANFIIRGGTDKAADLAANIAAPTGTVKED
jgi:hypothetical protein